ncbi:NIPSNAP family protein [Paenibacillus gansuensis]|uniref:NIPSNAP family protein n=1 Tax=Paenibacillus gansuensis TaxID=306542 RepID=A0ABW5PIZ9_9BACL
MLYELRIYQVVPGRMQAILDQFRDGTIGIFAKHNMKVTNFAYMSLSFCQDKNGPALCETSRAI